METSTTVQLAKDLADYRRTLFVPLERKLYGDTLCRIAVGRDGSKKVLHENGWEEAPTWEAWCVFVDLVPVANAVLVGVL